MNNIQKRWRVCRGEEGQYYFNCNNCHTTFIRVELTSISKLNLRNGTCGDEIGSQIRGRCKKCGIRHDVTIADIENETNLSQSEKYFIISKLEDRADNFLKRKYGIEAYIRKGGPMDALTVYFETSITLRKAFEKDLNYWKETNYQEYLKALKYVIQTNKHFLALLKREGFPLQPDTEKEFFQGSEQNAYLQYWKEYYEHLIKISVELNAKGLNRANLDKRMCK